MTDDPYTTCRDHTRTIELLGDRHELRKLMGLALTPAARPDVIKGLARMRMLTVSKTSETGEMAMLLAAFAEELECWPADAVMAGLKSWPRSHKFWPTLSELLEEIKGHCELRLAVADRLGVEIR